MDKYISLEQIDRIVAIIRSRISSSPQIGLILGSGLGEM
jgi:purine nucleoside phosphorylase